VGGHVGQGGQAVGVQVHVLHTRRRLRSVLHSSETSIHKMRQPFTLLTVQEHVEGGFIEAPDECSVGQSQFEKSYCRRGGFRALIMCPV
jgi:hypothetical protein